MAVDLDDCLARAEVEKQAAYQLADAERNAKHAAADARYDDLLRAIQTLRPHDIATAAKQEPNPPTPVGTNGHPTRIALSPSATADDRSVPGVTAAIREALKDLTEPYTSSRIGKWMQTRYPLLYERRKYIPSALNKLTEAGVLEKTKAGSPTEPTEYRLVGVRS